MSKKKLVPKLKFKEFEGKYKLKKIEDEFNLIRNYSYSRNDEGEGKYHHVHYGDIHSRYSVYIDQTVSVPSIKKTKKHIKLDYGDVIVADASEDYADLGKATILLDQGNRKYIAGLHTFALRAQDNTDPLYFVYYSKTEQYKQYMSRIGTGTSVYGITRKNLQDMNYLAPSIEEQQKIGSFFKKIDEMIQLQQSKVNKVKDLKSAYLSEMFPKEGEKYPKRRFEGFTEPWIKRPLSDLGDIITGTTPSTKNETYYSENGIPWVTPTDIYKNITYISKRHLSKAGQQVSKVVPKDTILVTSIASIGKNTLLGRVGSFNQQINALVPNNNLHNPYFLFTQSVFWSAKMKQTAASGTMQIVNKTEFSKISTEVPVLEEQIKIGNFFKNFDNQISTEEEKLMKLEKLKQAYLNDMFV